MSIEEQQREVVDFLAQSETHNGHSVERISTHGAHIFLAGERAYKLKRARRLPFLDYSTPDRRLAMLNAEFTINRELAPSLYLGVIPVIRAGGRLKLGRAGTGGEIVDWVLVMRRFSGDDLLDVQAQRGNLPLELMQPLAAAIATMHKQAPVVRRLEGEIFSQIALDNFSAFRNSELKRTLLDRIEAEVRDECSRLMTHLNMRASQGMVRRCHGDLHLRNIVCFQGRPTPFDALEFEPNLATGDVYYDLAFLLMDLDHRGLRGHANVVLNSYIAETEDLEGLAALPLFLAVRALVRAKVAVLSPTFNEKDSIRSAAEADSYIQLATSYLPRHPPQLVAIGGLSGTGKSRAAYRLAPDILPAPGAIVLRSDSIRKHLHGVSESMRLPKSAYTPAATRRVYDEIMRHASRCLRSGHSCILDAVFAVEAERQEAEAVAENVGCNFTGVWLEADLATRVARVSQRKNDASDADTGVVRHQEHFAVGDVRWHRVDASNDVNHSVHQIRDALRSSRR
jgi:aminoglycoside phosphotransferase family enzyme/predicted kinase